MMNSMILFIDYTRLKNPIKTSSIAKLPVVPLAYKSSLGHPLLLQVLIKLQQGMKPVI